MKNFSLLITLFLCILTALILFISAAKETVKADFKADGYASLNGGTTGGAKANKKNIYTAANKAELIKILKNSKGELNNDPKIIIISGTIDLCVDKNNKPLSEKDFTVKPYSIEAYTAAYDPKIWGRKRPTGDQENARKSSQENQEAIITVAIGSNTTLMGKNKDAKIINGNLLIEKANNIIIKNITFEDAFDFFPEWDPLDGYDKAADTGGRWNSQYDLISIVGSTNIWIDHCTFSDGDRPDSSFPQLLDQQYQHHDGAVDITKQANYITLSYNKFFNHDKTSLIGSSDSNKADSGNLKVTVHHNYYKDSGQRMPRVRYGEVHVYNNYYENISVYAIGIGANASIYAESNFFENITEPALQIKYFDSKGPGYIKDINNMPAIKGIAAADDGIHTGSVAWEPKDRYSYKADKAEEVKNICQTYSGADKPDRQ